MGLRWTYMCVYWRALEPDGPVDPDRELPPAWKELDDFVIEAHQRKLNVLMQAPVVGGNAGGPPDWAGRREAGKSAPQDMDALAIAFKVQWRRFVIDQDPDWIEFGGDVLPFNVFPMPVEIFCLVSRCVGNGLQVPFDVEKNIVDGKLGGVDLDAGD